MKQLPSTTTFSACAMSHVGGGIFVTSSSNDVVYIVFIIPDRYHWQVLLFFFRIRLATTLALPSPLFLCLNLQCPLRRGAEEALFALVALGGRSRLLV